MSSLQYDIRSSGIEEFVSFLFDHEVVPLSHRSEAPKPWYVDAEVNFDPIRVVALYTQLFTEPRPWLSRFSNDQLEQGFWAIVGGNLECGVEPVIWDEAVPHESREGCIRSMFFLFERFFADKSLEPFPFMWWDPIIDGWEWGNHIRENGGEDRSLQNALFETISRTLFLPSQECQRAALHGLGHLRHPETPAVVHRYLERNEPIEHSLREYAHRASRFDVL